MKQEQEQVFYSVTKAVIYGQLMLEALDDVKELSIFKHSLKHKVNQVEKELFEAQLEYQYLSSPGVLTDKIQKYSNTNYKNLELSQIYINIENFLSEKRKQTKIIVNEEKNN